MGWSNLLQTNLTQSRQCTYTVTEARSCNHCCGGKGLSITYSECVSGALIIQRTMRMRHIVICCLSGSTVFFHIIPYCHLLPVRLYSIFPHYPILSSVACPALQFFPHYLINGMIFEKKILSNMKCVFWSSLNILSEIFLILRRTERDMIKNVYWQSKKCPLFLSCFKVT